MWSVSAKEMLDWVSFLQTAAPPTHWSHCFFQITDCNSAFMNVFHRHVCDQACSVTDSAVFCAAQWLWTSRHPGSKWTWTRVASLPTVAVDTSSNRASCAAPRPTLTQRTQEEGPVTSPLSWLYGWVANLLSNRVTANFDWLTQIHLKWVRIIYEIWVHVSDMYCFYSWHVFILLVFSFYFFMVSFCCFFVLCT